MGAVAVDALEDPPQRVAVGGPLVDEVAHELARAADQRLRDLGERPLVAQAVAAHLEAQGLGVAASEHVLLPAREMARDAQLELRPAREMLGRAVLDPVLEVRVDLREQLLATPDVRFDESLPGHGRKCGRGGAASWETWSFCSGTEREPARTRHADDRAQRPRGRSRLRAEGELA